MRSRLDEFTSALAKYGRLSGIDPDVEGARKVEEEQLRIMDEVRDRARPDVGLDQFLEELRGSGELGRIVEEVARTMGEDLEGGWEGALRSAMDEGGLDPPGAKSALIALQAVARAYAEAYEAEGGEDEEESAYCPLCGTQSGTMYEEDGVYRMACPFCGHSWTVSRDRMACPFCGERDRIGVFTDRDEGVGLAYCQGCGSTWHVILREIDAPTILLPLIAMGAERFRSSLPHPSHPSHPSHPYGSSDSDPDSGLDR